MPIKYVVIREVKKGELKKGGTYPYAIDHEGTRFNLFPPLPPVEAGKAYCFHLEQKGEYENVVKIEPVINIFKQQALKEVASKSEIVRNVSVSVTQAIQALAANQVEFTPDKLFAWANAIYQYVDNKANELMPKDRSSE